MSKYPRTPHLSWSEGISSDDLLLPNEEPFKMVSVVITEKMDGENTTLSYDRIHARSIDSRDHVSRHWVKQLWSGIKNDIPQGMSVIGENLFAKHSIYYDRLPSFFLVFAIFNEESCLSWDETKDWCKLLGLEHVPVLFEGKWNKSLHKELFTGQSKCGGEQEGYVIRTKESFLITEFNQNMAKFVRKNHVQTDDHWLNQPLFPNKMLKTV